jgi:hypothetical protein
MKKTKFMLNKILSSNNNNNIDMISLNQNSNSNLLNNNNKDGNLLFNKNNENQNIVVFDDIPDKVDLSFNIQTDENFPNQYRVIGKTIEKVS